MQDGVYQHTYDTVQHLWLDNGRGILFRAINNDKPLNEFFNKRTLWRTSSYANFELAIRDYKYIGTYDEIKAALQLELL